MSDDQNLSLIGILIPFLYALDLRLNALGTYYQGYPISDMVKNQPVSQVVTKYYMSWWMAVTYCLHLQVEGGESRLTFQDTLIIKYIAVRTSK